MDLFRRRTVLATAAFSTAAILVLLVGIYVGPPGFEGWSPDAVARTGQPPVSFGVDLPPYAVSPYGRGLAGKPPMGWNGFNRYTRDVNDSIVRAMARALVNTGMKALGYTYVNLDGGWDLPQRGHDGELVPDPKKFPHGIKALADYVHGLGLKFGIYTSAGFRNCAGTTAGSYGHYEQDARQFASWDVDFVKLDWCYMPLRDNPLTAHLMLSDMLARQFGEAIIATGRPMVLDVNDWIDPPVSQWANYLGNMWRVGPDIRDSYPSMVSNFIRDVSHYTNAGPDHWNDPDMLEVGNGGMTVDEQRTQFTLWSELSAPLIAGNNLTDMTPEAFAILTNASVIGVDQDPLGAQGYPVTNKNGHWVLTKPLASGNRAVVLFNQTDKAAVIGSSVHDIGLTGAPRYQLQDLWTGQVLWTKKMISALVQPHCAVMYIVAPQA